MSNVLEAAFYAVVGASSLVLGAVIVFGTLLDGVPESFILGLTLVAGGGVSWAFLAAVALLTMLADTMMPGFRIRGPDGGPVHRARLRGEHRHLGP